MSAAQVDRDVALVRKSGLAGLVALLQGLEVVAVATAPTKEEYFTAAGILRLGTNLMAACKLVNTLSDSHLNRILANKSKLACLKCYKQYPQVIINHISTNEGLILS